MVTTGLPGSIQSVNSHRQVTVTPIYDDLSAGYSGWTMGQRGWPSVGCSSARPLDSCQSPVLSAVGIIGTGWAFTGFVCDNSVAVLMVVLRMLQMATWMMISKLERQDPVGNCLDNMAILCRLQNNMQTLEDLSLRTHCHIIDLHSTWTQRGSVDTHHARASQKLLALFSSVSASVRSRWETIGLGFPAEQLYSICIYIYI